VQAGERDVTTQGEALVTTERSTGIDRPHPLCRGWIFFVVAAVAVVAGVGVYLQGQPQVYTSSAVVALTPKGPRPVSAAVVTLTAPRYVAYATSPFALRKAAEQLKLDPAVASRAVVVTMAAATANVTITATMRDGKTAMRTVNEVAALILERATGDPILTAQVESYGVVPGAPSGPHRRAILGAGVLAGLALGALLWLGVERYLRRRRTTRVRGVIPLSSAPGDDTVALSTLSPS
jgi:uncharacterized protein involved in exopolysaccharide biosynthesis